MFCFFLRVLRFGSKFGFCALSKSPQKKVVLKTDTESCAQTLFTSIQKTNKIMRIDVIDIFSQKD